MPSCLTRNFLGASRITFHKPFSRETGRTSILIHRTTPLRPTFSTLAQWSPARALAEWEDELRIAQGLSMQQIERVCAVVDEINAAAVRNDGEPEERTVARSAGRGRGRIQRLDRDLVAIGSGFDQIAVAAVGGE